MIVALLLAALVASAISAARTSQKAAAIRATIGKLSQILESQPEQYASKPDSMAGMPVTSSGTPPSHPVGQASACQALPTPAKTR